MIDKSVTIKSSTCLAQGVEDESFIGGVPKLPPNSAIPVCNFCGTELTFYFQIAFPDGHKWNGLTLSVFACTACVDEDWLIPEMLPGPLQGIDIPENFLLSYQRNFTLIVYETNTGISRNDYVEKVVFERLCFDDVNIVDSNKNIIGQVGGEPTWILEDEAPMSYAGSIPMCFLMQLKEDIKFMRLKSAPRQLVMTIDGTPTSSKHDFYELFIGNTIYFFGTDSTDYRLVYVITQID